jgi:hypothetical protein
MTEDAPNRYYRQEVTDATVKLLESGTTPWQKPWRSDGTMRLPMNPVSAPSTIAERNEYACPPKELFPDSHWPHCCR